LETNNEPLIKEQLIALLNNKYQIPLSSLNPDQWDVPITSREIGFSGFELAHLFFEVEKIYGKRFEESVLKDYGFCTINNIAKAICS
jgi:hypothetical protein